MTEQRGTESIPLRSRLPALLPLAAVWICAALPVVFYVIHLSDPGLAVGIALTGKYLLVLGLLSLLAALLLGLTVYPPLPAGIRRYFDRLRTAWSTDPAPLIRALSDLQHFENAQKHFEVAKLAWLRGDYRMVGTHAKRATELDPQMPHAQHLLGQFLLRMKSLPEARRAFEAAEQLDKGHAFGSALLHAAHLQHVTGDLDKALATFAQHEREHGSGPRSNFWHGEALAAAGKLVEAAQAFLAAAADPKMKLTSEENWFRALARVRCRRIRGGGSA